MTPSQVCVEGNLNVNISPELAREPAEQVELLVSAKGVRIERIVSMGHRSPDDFWYDQPEDEFVLLTSGAARLLIEHQGERALKAGDWIHLKARVRHRVEWTDPTCPAVWLAVFVQT